MTQKDNVQKSKIWKQLFETTTAVRNFYVRNMPHKPKTDLSISQLRVISCIFFSESKSMRIKDIADELGITAGGISQSVDVLVNAGLLTRCKDEHDRRAVAVRLSEYGEEVRAEVYKAFESLFSPFLEGVSEEKQHVFTEVLEIISENVKNKKIK